jgi:hypothetical protein
LLECHRRPFLSILGKGTYRPKSEDHAVASRRGYADVTTFCRNDFAYAEDHSIYKNPHTYVQRWMLGGLSGPIGRGGLQQMAIFLASRGQTIIHPEPARFFEVPVHQPLPEDFSYIP